MLCCVSAVFDFVFDVRNGDLTSAKIRDSNLSIWSEASILEKRMINGKIFWGPIIFLPIPSFEWCGNLGRIVLQLGFVDLVQSPGGKEEITGLYIPVDNIATVDSIETKESLLEDAFS